jgi:hypothetical protein
VGFPIEAPRPARIGAGNFLEKRKEHCPSKEWAGLIIENPIMRNLYRMYTPGVDLDADLLNCANELESRDPATVFYLKMIWRTLMQNYAIPQALKVGKLLMCSSEGMWWSFWRLLQGYSLPRLWVALAIGYVPLCGSDRLRRLLHDLATQSGPRNLALAAMFVFIFYLGMTDVQRRVGRAWGRVLRRSLGLFVLGAAYAGAAWGLHCSGWLTGGRPDPHYALLLAACALLLGHLVQLFWADNSVSDPL